MKKSVLSIVFIGLFSWFGLFGDEAPTNNEASQRSGIIKRPIEW